MSLVIVLIILIVVWDLHNKYTVHAYSNKYRITKKFSVLWDCYFYTLDYKYSFLCIQLNYCIGEYIVNKWIKKYSLKINEGDK